MIPEWPASFGSPEYDEMRPLILDHADKMLNQSGRMKVLDSNKIIGELQVLAQGLGDKDSALVTQAVDLIEHLVETRVSPPADLDLRLYVSQLITILGNVLMNLSGGARPDSYSWVQQSPMPYPAYGPPPRCQNPWGEPPR